jgi:hypothetical protein
MCLCVYVFMSKRLRIYKCIYPYSILRTVMFIFADIDGDSGIHVYVFVSICICM